MYYQVINKAILINALLFLSLLFSCKIEKDSAYYYAKSNELWFKNKPKSSYKMILKAIKVDPKNDSLYVRAAYCYQFAYLKDYKEKSYDQKIRGFYNKSLDLKPWNANAILSRAQYDLDHHRTALVLRNLDSLLVRDKKNVRAYCMKAQIYSYGGGNSDSAKYFENFNEGLKNITEKDKPLLYGNIIGGYLLAKNWEMAKYYELLSLKIKTQENTNNLAVCYYKMCQMDSACYYFKEKLCSGYPCGIYKDSLKIKCK